MSGVSNFSNLYFLKIKQKALKLIIPLLKKLKDCSFSFLKQFHLSESSPLLFTPIPILLWVYWTRSLFKLETCNSLLRQSFPSEMVLYIHIYIHVYIIHFHESFRVNRTQDYGLKTWKQVQNYLAMWIFWKHSYWWLPASSNSLQSKSFVNNIFYGAKNNKLIRQGN